MWASTRSRGTERAAIAVASVLFASLAVAASLPGPPLPEPAARLVPDAAPVGGAEFRAFGLHVYDAWLWGPGATLSDAEPFALDIVYHRALDGSAIAERSVDEIARLGYGTAADRERWGERLRAILPDVRRGDRLTGVRMPGAGARFFHNGHPIGAITDRGFAHAFFAIWLDPRTSRPDFRARLLGRR